MIEKELHVSAHMRNMSNCYSALIKRAVADVTTEFLSYRFKSLTEISRGNVLISKYNKELWFAETIVWDDITDTGREGREITIDTNSPPTCEALKFVLSSVIDVLLQWRTPF